MKLKYEVVVPAVDPAWFRTFSEELIRIVTTLRFDSDGVLQLAGADGLERSGLCLVNGRHLETGAQYELPKSGRTLDRDPDATVVLNTWTDKQIGATVSGAGKAMSLAAKRSARYGMSEIHLEKVASGGSSLRRVQWSARLDAGDWFNERRSAGVVTITHAFAVATIRLRQRRGGGHPLLEINCSVKGRAAAKPFVAGGLWANSDRIRRYLERDLKRMTERFGQTTLPEPQVAAHRVLVAVLAPERLKF